MTNRWERSGFGRDHGLGRHLLGLVCSYLNPPFTTRQIALILNTWGPSTCYYAHALKYVCLAFQIYWIGDTQQSVPQIYICVRFSNTPNFFPKHVKLFCWQQKILSPYPNHFKICHLICHILERFHGLL